MAAAIKVGVWTDVDVRIVTNLAGSRVESGVADIGSVVFCAEVVVDDEDFGIFLVVFSMNISSLSKIGLVKHVDIYIEQNFTPEVSDFLTGRT